MRWFPEFSLGPRPTSEPSFSSPRHLRAAGESPDPSKLSADWSATVAGGVSSLSTAPHGDALPVKLKLDDRVAALQAIQFTLDEVGDGATYLWHRKDGELHGYREAGCLLSRRQRPRLPQAQLALTVGDFSREVEGVACRAEDKRWLLGH